MRKSSVFSVCIAALLASCAVVAPQPAAEVSKSVTLARADDNGSLVSPQFEGKVFALFPLINGSLAGKVDSSDIVLRLPGDFSAPLDISLTRLAERIAPRASTLSDQGRLDGLIVAPKETRLARVGTFFSRRESGPSDAGAGFVDTQTKEALFLAFFDRPCEVTGLVSAGAISIRLNVVIPSDGMHWLRIKKPEPTRWTIERAAPQTPVSMVTSGPL